MYSLHYNDSIFLHRNVRQMEKIQRRNFRMSYPWTEIKLETHNEIKYTDCNRPINDRQ